MLVPTGHTAEIHQLTLKNESAEVKNLKVFSLHRVVPVERLRRHDQLPAQLLDRRGRGRENGATLYHKTEYRERRDHYAFYNVNADVAGYDTDRESFLGLYNEWGEPQVPAKGQSSNSVASGWQPIASHGLDVKLAPGEEKTFVFTLGYVEVPRDQKWEKPGIINKKPAHDLIAKFSKPSRSTRR
jgi:cellobiose phosphorylase